MYKNLKIGLFLAIRQVKKANPWINTLIIFIMTITFLNLVFISGLLEGLVTGASKDLRNHYSGDIIIAPNEDKLNITNTNQLLKNINGTDNVQDYTVRYLQGGKVQAGQLTPASPNTESNAISAIIAGVDFEKEQRITGLSQFIVAGNYIDNFSTNGVLVGSGLLSQYESAIDNSTLEGVTVGSKIKITIKENPREYTVVGILQSKVSQINSRIFIDDRQFTALAGRSPQISDEIAVTLFNPEKLQQTRSEIAAFTDNSEAQAETWQESQGQFFEDLSSTFTILGAVIGFIGLAVASVTLFIVVFINAISREKYIGILKGIGVAGPIIKSSYVMQSIFYALAGSLIGLILLYVFLVPYFDENPIDFPFSDGILDVTPQGVVLRLLILFVSSVAAGLIPSHLIVKKNTIDSILGR